MCGRYSLTVDLNQLFFRFSLDQDPIQYQPRYNIAPGQMIAAIIADRGVNRLGLLRWGLVPSWAKDEKIGYKLINAKAETLREKPAFNGLFQSKRCIIPADGFFEWKNVDGKKTTDEDCTER